MYEESMRGESVEIPLKIGARQQLLQTPIRQPETKYFIFILLLNKACRMSEIERAYITTDEENHEPAI